MNCIIPNNTFYCQLLLSIIVCVLESKGRSDKSWLQTVLAKGTASDKTTAHILTIQDNPVYNLQALRNLVNMVRVSKKKECVSVIGKI